MTVGNIDSIIAAIVLEDLHDHQLENRQNKIPIIVAKLDVTSSMQTILDIHWATFSQMWMINMGPIVQEKIDIVSNKDDQQTQKVSKHFIR